MYKLTSPADELGAKEFTVELSADARSAKNNAETELDGLQINANFGDKAYDVAHACWFAMTGSGWAFQFSMSEA